MESTTPVPKMREPGAMRNGTCITMARDICTSAARQAAREGRKGGGRAEAAEDLRLGVAHVVRVERERLLARDEREDLWLDGGWAVVWGLEEEFAKFFGT